MIYRIKVTYRREDTQAESPHPLTGPITRKRSDAAHALLIETVRREVASIAGLDSAWGVRAIRESLDADVRKGGSIAIGSHSRVWFSCSKYV